MHEIALASGRLVELMRQSMNDARVEVPNPRQRVAQALLAAGVDHAVSINFLLSRPSPSAAFSAAALFRLELDVLSRGIFFALPEFSSDEEVADFMLNDHMPWVKPPGKKKRRMRLDELIARLRDFVAKVSPGLANEALHLRFSYALDAFNGIVHGGRDVVEAYQEHSEFGLIFHPDFNALANMALHATTLSVLAEMTQLFVVAGLKTVVFSNEDERKRIHEAFLEAGKRVKPPLAATRAKTITVASKDEP